MPEMVKSKVRILYALGAHQCGTIQSFALMQWPDIYNLSGAVLESRVAFFVTTFFTSSYIIHAEIAQLAERLICN